MNIKVNGEWKNHVTFVRRTGQETPAKVKVNFNPEYLYPVVHKALPAYPCMGVKYFFNEEMNVKVTPGHLVELESNFDLQSGECRQVNNNDNNMLYAILLKHFSHKFYLTITEDLLLDDGTVNFSVLKEKLQQNSGATHQLCNTASVNFMIENGNVVYVKRPDLEVGGFIYPDDTVFGHDYFFPRRRVCRSLSIPDGSHYAGKFRKFTKILSKPQERPTNNICYVRSCKSRGIGYGGGKEKYYKSVYHYIAIRSFNWCFDEEGNKVREYRYKIVRG